MKRIVTTLASLFALVTLAVLSQAATIPAGAKGVKIVFKTGSEGSFDDPSSGIYSSGTGGTSFLEISRIFDTNGDLLSSSNTSSTWPGWFKTAGVKISGSGNANATDSECARFASVTERTSALCDWDQDGSGERPCGALTGFYRVSEVDCHQGIIPQGTGSATDGVAIMVELDKDPSVFGEDENLLVIVQYTSSAVHGGTNDGTNCFDGTGALTETDENCQDQTWKMFLKTSPTAASVLLPGELFIPPYGGWIDTLRNIGGGKPQTRQFVIPISAMSSATTLQFSRINSKNLLDYSSQVTVPTPICVGTAGGSCVLALGVIFKSITIIRI